MTKDLEPPEKGSTLWLMQLANGPSFPLLPSAPSFLVRRRTKQRSAQALWKRLYCRGLSTSQYHDLIFLMWYHGPQNYAYDFGLHIATQGYGPPLLPRVSGAVPFDLETWAQAPAEEALATYLQRFLRLGHGLSIV